MLGIKKLNPALYIDYYKGTHSYMYPKELSRVDSYLTPRGSRTGNDSKLTMFALQYFNKHRLIEDFNQNFFSRPFDEVIDEYKRIMDNTLGQKCYDIKKIESLHKLGYLPIKISAIPEGTRVPMKVPMIHIQNTHPDFPWVTEYIESLLSAEMWHPMISANVGYKFRQIVNKYFEKCVNDDFPRASALGDFSFRGQESPESAAKSSAAFLLSFINTATVSAIPFLETYYNCDCSEITVGRGSPSTEHSVMVSNFMIDGDEKTMIRRMLTELYPDSSFSIVLDSYDYWNVVDNILPELKKDILEHNGTMLVRGDSGNPVEIVTKTVFKLWDIFGGYINKKGYKVLNDHVRAIYGDSITPEGAEEIYQILIENGFACNNVVLGMGSFSMQCIKSGENLYPFTRDSYQIAIKATYCETKDGRQIPMCKEPKTDKGKTSQKGLCVVYLDENNEIKFKDGYTADTIKECPYTNLLEPVFENSKMIKEYSLTEIRNRLHNNNF